MSDSNLKAQVLESGNKLANKLKKTGIEVEFGRHSEGYTDLTELVDIAIDNIGSKSQFDIETSKAMRGNTVVITARLYRNNIPAPNRLLELYDDTVFVDDASTDSDGYVHFEVLVTEDKNYVVKFGSEASEIVHVDTYGEFEYQPLLDGTETVYTVDTYGSYEFTENNELKVSVNANGRTETAVLTDYIINNNENWEFNCKLKKTTTNNNYLQLFENYNPINNFRIYITLNKDSGNCKFYLIYNNNTVKEITINGSFPINEYVPISVKKTNNTTLIISVDGQTTTIESPYINLLMDLSLGFSSTHYSNDLYVKDIYIKTSKTLIDYDTVIYQPIITSLDQITVLSGSDTSISTSENWFSGDNCYLTDGFANLNKWKLTCKVFRNGNYSGNCAFGLYKKGTESASLDTMLYRDTSFISYSSENFSISRNDIQTTQAEWLTCTMERKGDDFVFITLNNDSRIKIYWKDLSLYEYLCIGTFMFTHNTHMRIKDIVVKTVGEVE